MLEVAFDGHLVKAPEARTSATGNDFKSLRVAVKNVDSTEWVTVSAFNRVAKEVPEDLGKGTRIYVEGTLSIWRNEKGASLSVLASRIELLGLVGRRPRRRRRKPTEDEANGKLGRRLRRRSRKPIETPAVGGLSEEDLLLAEQYADGTIPI